MLLTSSGSAISPRYLDALDLDGTDRLIGPLPGRTDRRRDRRHGEHPPAIGPQCAVGISAGPGVQDGHPFDGTGRVETTDHIPASRVGRVARGGSDDTDGGGRRTRDPVGNPPPGGRGEEPRAIPRHAG